MVTITLMSVVLFGCLGLAVDLGRLYIAKNEAQSFADAAALAGALKLDGTTAGVTAASTAATTLPDKYNFTTTSFTGTVVEVAKSSSGPWTNAGSPPNPATDYIYLRVTAQAPVTMYFLPVVTAFASGNNVNSSTAKAQAVAGQIPQTTWNEGLFPFSPIAFDGPTGGNNTSAPWGFVAGDQYTMRYQADGKGACAGPDTTDSIHVKTGSDRGFWGSTSASALSAQIEGDQQTESLTVGESLPDVGGAKTTAADAIVSRIDQDGDTSDDTWSDYIANSSHNGRRVVIMPLQSETDGEKVLGFGSFLLLDDGAYGHTGNSNWCAVFIGLATVTDSTSSNSQGGSSTVGPYQVKLVQ